MVNKIAELIAPHIEGLSAEDIISLIEIIYSLYEKSV